MSRSEQILNYIKDHIRNKGYSPTLREIGAAVGLASSSTVHGHIQRLEAKGLIKFCGVRAIEILDSEPEVTVIEKFQGVPITIKWQGRIYHHDPIMDV